MFDSKEQKTLGNIQQQNGDNWFVNRKMNGEIHNGGSTFILFTVFIYIGPGIPLAPRI